MRRWFSDGIDIRSDNAVFREILSFIEKHRAKSVVITEGIIGCPHEEEVDYPKGEICPHCPYWANRDRWTGEVIH